jgi:hypothetical protein
MERKAFLERTWRSADGRLIPVKDLDLGHFVNILNWIHDHKYHKDTIADFVKVAADRKFVGFAEGTPYPDLIDGRWAVVDPDTGKGEIIPPPAEYSEAMKTNEAYQEMRAKLKVDPDAK